MRRKRFIIGMLIYLCIGLTYAILTYNRATHAPDAHITGMDRGFMSLGPIGFAFCFVFPTLA